jgi:8-hydroxy-5-deazaflavin:NADPH oxidoreductase
VGAGRIGGGAARMFARAGHELLVSGGRNPSEFAELANDIGGRSGTTREAVDFGEVFVFSVPWRVIDDVLPSLGPLDGKIVIDTTNQFGSRGVEDLGGRTAAQVNAARMPGARYTKSFNTLTSAFQAETAGRTGDDRIVQWICGDDAEAKAAVAGLLDDMGYAPVDLGGVDGCEVMEAPRRPGAVYGEEWRLPEAWGVVDAVARGEPIPPTPSYA